MIPVGYCCCGCGEKTRVATKTDRGAGQVRGIPLRFVTGHNNHLRRKTPHEVRDCGYSTPCWVWLKGRNERGYGLTSSADGGSGRVAHKVYWEREHGPVPEGLELDHLCRVRHCVNPAHLEPVTHKENVRRGYAIVAGAIADGLGGRIKMARLAAGMSQADLALAVGCSQQTICNWERNTHPPTGDASTRLVEVLRLDPFAVEERRERQAHGKRAA